MGWTATKKAILAALRDGKFQYEVPDKVYQKNKLASGDVDPEYLIDVILRSNGNNYDYCPYHKNKSINVHIVRKDGWYIKFYFIEDVAFFISVHSDLDGE